MRPVWSLEVIRTTNAPMSCLTEALLDRTFHALWRPGSVPVGLSIVVQTAELLEVRATRRPCWGVIEEALYRVESCGEGQKLVYQGRFKGWPVLLCMGWWRLALEYLWERFLELL